MIRLYDLELCFVFQKGLYSQLDVESIGISVIDFSAARESVFYSLMFQYHFNGMRVV